MRLCIVILLVMALAAAFLVLNRDLILKTVVEEVLQATWGLDAYLRSFSLGLTRPVVHIKGLLIFNPDDFPDRVMLDMPEIYIRYEPLSVVKGRIHIDEMRLHLRECLVVKNKAGLLNVDAMRLWNGRKDEDSAAAERRPRAPKLLIDRLQLKITRAVYKDYRGAGAPAVTVFPLGIDESFENVDDLYTLGRILVVRALRTTRIPALAGIDIAGLNDLVGKAMATGNVIAGTTHAVTQGALDRTGRVANAIRDQVQGLVGGVAGDPADGE